MKKFGVPSPAPADSTSLKWLQSRISSIDEARARQENFPVASRLLRADTRRDLLDIYALARLIDDIGDEAPGDRLALLDLIDEQLCSLTRGEATLGPVASLTSAVRERGLPVTPFRHLVAANRMDQEVTRYADLEALRGYCRLSAEPVGHLVLAVWQRSDAERRALSDDVCTGLQIAEHLQDVGEDLAAGRVYLPQDILARHGVTEDLLAAPTAALSWRDRGRVEAVLAEVGGEARALLAAGRPLAAKVPGVLRIAVSGFAAGGLAAIDAVLAAGAEAIHATQRPRRSRVLSYTARTLASTLRSSR